MDGYSKAWSAGAGLFFLIMAIRAEAKDPYLGEPLPAGHPITNTAWIGRELAVTDQGSVSVTLIYVMVHADGTYTAWGAGRKLGGCGVQLGNPWTGRIYVLSRNILAAWNDGAAGVHGYLVTADTDYQVVHATLFTKTAPVIENSVWVRTKADINQVVRVLEPFFCP